MADTVSYPSMTGVTRKKLREDIGRGLGDLVVITATANSAGLTTFTDANTLVDEPRYYAGREVYFTYGTAANQGLLRHIQSSSQSTHTLTFTAPVNEPVAIGDEAHMVNWRGVGFTIADYHNVIDKIFRDLTASHYETPAMFTVSENFDAATGTIILPSDFVSVESIEYYDQFDGWREIYQSEGGIGNGWQVDRYQNAIQLSPQLISRLRSNAIRVKGLADPSPPEYDGDMIYLPHEWMVVEAQALLLEQSMTNNPGVGERSRLFVQKRERANNIRPLGFTRPGAFSERIR